MKKYTRTIITILVLVGLGVITRLIPHLWNATPILAIGLFAGTYLHKHLAYIVPLIALFIGDLIIGFYNPQVMIAVYGSFALIGGLSYFIRRQKSFGTITLTVLSGSILFFLITNWAVWQFSGMYSPTLDGLLLSYTMGLPFFKSALIGDIAYTLSLFALYELGHTFFTSYKKKHVALITSSLSIFHKP